MSDIDVSFYEKLYLIRKAELTIQKYYSEDEMKTPMHMSMGEEAIAVGICSALKQTDQVFCTYRSHAVYLSKTNDITTFFAEMYGKDTSIQKGKGGSMHLCSPDYGFMGTAAIVGGVIPVAIGAAFANKVLENGKTVVVFFGDGAVDEGSFWESINIACLMHLPILFVCEDNGLAVHTSKEQRRGYNSLTDIISKFNCLVYKESTTDVEIIYKLAIKAIYHMQITNMPSFLHLNYYRYLEHVGVNMDFEEKYRPIDEFEKWRELDPITLQRNKLCNKGIEESVIKKIESRIDNLIEKSIVSAKSAPFPDESELYKEVYV
jgi:TPP-dependent pyruvate/acetoin dehydrogenase alpha subunit